MDYKQVNVLYFSATGTTKKIVSAVANGLGLKEIKFYDIVQVALDDISFPADEIVIVGFPVFSGRVPEIVVKALQGISGNRTPVVLTCVYGNREFDDALLEMKDLLEKKNFILISAAAFVAQHAIFPRIACGRPDTLDLLKAREFGASSIKCSMQTCGNKVLVVPGNKPYRPTKRIPLIPQVKKGCTACGVCAKQCPVQAIDACHPKKTNKNKCISCAHCIAVCPNHVRAFQGIMYALVRSKFEKAYNERKEPFITYLQG